MTISPGQPVLEYGAEEGIKIMKESHLTFVNVGFCCSLMVLIGEGFKTDGQSTVRVMKWKCRWLCDLLYQNILVQNGYMFIGLVGWRNWDSVTDLERDRTRENVFVSFVLNRKIPQIVNQLKG